MSNLSTASRNPNTQHLGAATLAAIVDQARRERSQVIWGAIGQLFGRRDRSDAESQSARETGACPAR